MPKSSHIPYSTRGFKATLENIAGLTIGGNDGEVIIKTGSSSASTTTILSVDTTNKRVGVNNASPAVDLDVSGNITCATLNYTALNPPISGGSTNVRNDLALQALHVGKTNSTPAYALANTFLDVYANGTGIASNTNAPLSDDGFVSTINVAATTITPLADGVSNGQSLSIGNDAAGNANSRFTSSAVGSGWWVLNDNASHQSGKFTWIFTCIQNAGGSGPNFFFGPQKNVEAAGGYAGNAEHAHVSIGGPAAQVGDKMKVIYDTSVENTLLGYLDTGSGYGSALTVTKGANFDSTTLSTLFWFAGCWSDTSAPWVFDVSVVKETTTSNTSGNYVSVTQAANASVSSMGIVVLYKNNAGTTTLNTDLIAQISADNGGNYTTVTLAPQGTFSTGITQAIANDVSVTAGTQLKYKISFANQSLGVKETRVYGVALIY